MEDGNRSSRPLDANDTGNNMAAEGTLHDRLPLTCSHCNQSFSIRADLKKHIKCLHPDVLKKPHKCDACSIAFMYPSDLKRHLKHAHSCGKPFKCPKCELSCKSEGNLKQHLLTHERNRERFKCSRCEKDYAWKVDLNRHWRDAHVSLNNEGNTKSENSQDNIEICISKNLLDSVHSPADKKRHQPRPYPCLQCDNSFRTQRGLGRHITCRHPEVKKKPHQCKVCQKSFPTPSKLMRHSAQVHNEDWPYGCSKCTFHCKTEWVLKSHLKIHDQYDGTPKCSICAKQFLSNVGLGNHLLTAHDSLRDKDNAKSDNSQNSGDEKQSQGEASGVLAETALGNYLKDVSKSFEKAIGTVDHRTTEPQSRSETKENAPGVNSQGVLFRFRFTRKEIFTSASQTPGPNNAQREPSGGTAEASPENISIAVSHGVQNDKDHKWND